MKTGRHEHRHEFGAEKEQEERVHHEGQREGGVGHLQEQAGRQADGVAEAASAHWTLVIYAPNCRRELEIAPTS